MLSNIDFMFIKVTHVHWSKLETYKYKLPMKITCNQILKWPVSMFNSFLRFI